MRANHRINTEVENPKYSFYYQNEGVNNFDAKSENSYSAMQERNRPLSDSENMAMSPKSNQNMVQNRHDLY